MKPMFITEIQSEGHLDRCRNQMSEMSNFLHVVETVWTDKQLRLFKTKITSYDVSNKRKEKSDGLGCA